jgi:dCTP deaminase
MSVKSDKWIKRMARDEGMIAPYDDSKICEGVISFGVSSYGYDIRLADAFKIFTNVNAAVMDPKQIDERNFIDFKGESCIIPHNSFVLGQSLEFFKIPRNIMAICLGKSTYARCGIIVNVTPLEPQWEGFITIAISNTSPLPTKIYANEGIAQVVFLEANETCEFSYADKKGKYQSQTAITHARM